MTKDHLRKEYKRRRNTLTLVEKSLLNEGIFEHLKRIDWSMYKYVHVYMTLEKFNEPDTSRFIKWIKEYHDDINFVVSKSDFTKGEMRHYILDDQTQLVENNWGILEPINGTLVDEQLLDLVIVPLLVVDSVGNRVGYGKGFYDRFLSICRKDVVSYGLSFFEPVASIDDVGEWDVKLSGCITSSKIYSFS